MHVILSLLRQVVIKHVSNVVDVQASGSYIGSDKYRQISSSKIGKNLLSLVLPNITRQGAARNIVAPQITLDFLGCAFGVDEHNGSWRLQLVNQAKQQRNFFIIGRLIQHLLHAFGCNARALRFDGLRIIHVLIGQLHDPMRQGGGKQHAQTLTGFRHAAQQKTDIGYESQIEHSVCLIKHHDFKPAQIKDLLLEIINQAARGTNKNIDPCGQLITLLLIVDTTVDHGGLDAGVPAKIVSVFFDLDSKLACRGNDQHARLIGALVGDLLA